MLAKPIPRVVERHIVNAAPVDQEAGANGLIAFERHGVVWKR